MKTNKIFKITITGTVIVISSLGISTNFTSHNTKIDWSIQNIDAIAQQEIELPKGYFKADFPCMNSAGDFVNTHRTSCHPNAGYDKECYAHTKCLRH